MGDRAAVITYLNSAWKNTYETQISFHVTKIMFTSVFILLFIFCLALSCTSNAVSLRMNRQNLEIITIMFANDSNTITTNATTASTSAAAGAITL